jgi:hypothetical protein
MMRSPLRFTLKASLALMLATAVAFPLVALAGHQFSDVPDGHFFHADVDALVDAGVTSGCSAGKFCPEANVTRGQMAAFMNRLGALAPDKAPVVNADKVDGRQANDLTRVVQGGAIATTTITSTGIVYVQVTLQAPTSGYVQLTSSVSIQGAGCTVLCNVTAYLSQTNGNPISLPMVQTVLGTTYETASPTTVTAVAPGTHTFQLRLIRSAGGNGIISGWYGEMTAHFSPFNGTGGVPATAPTAAERLDWGRKDALDPE